MKLSRDSKKPRTNTSREKLIGRLLKTFFRPIEGPKYPADFRCNMSQCY